jgi:hypothetical protein
VQEQVGDRQRRSGGRHRNSFGLCDFAKSPSPIPRLNLGWLTQRRVRGRRSAAAR